MHPAMCLKKNNPRIRVPSYLESKLIPYSFASACLYALKHPEVVFEDSRDPTVRSSLSLVKDFQKEMH